MPDTLESPIRFSPPGTYLDDLLKELGVSADRVLRSPSPGTAAESDLLHANEQLEIPCELIDGTLVEKAMGDYESLVASFLIAMMWNFVRPRKLGVVLGADSMFRLLNGNVRMPDVAFISKSQFPQGLPKGPIWDAIPSLVIEVISASNTPAEIERKRTEFFARGTQLFWTIDPATRSATVYDPANPIEGKMTVDTLNGDPALPGFTVNLPELFAVMDL